MVKSIFHAAVVVAHPDDETLWCGGLILEHPDWRWRVVTLCRASDPDRAARFHRVVERYGAVGAMGDLDDGPHQTPLPPDVVQETTVRLLSASHFDLLLTHGPAGEYTRHRRHEECCRAVVTLWQTGRLSIRQLWMFAYEDGGRAYLPRVQDGADRRNLLPEKIWLDKYRIMTQQYGFSLQSWEAKVTPQEEGYRCFEDPAAAIQYVTEGELTP